MQEPVTQVNHGKSRFAILEPPSGIDSRGASRESEGPGAVMRQSEVEYLERRVHEERRAARDARDPRVRSRHLELAEAYELRLRETIALERRSGFRFVDAA